ncbi:MAG TPA: DUF2283 domain-containing protein [Solirubrobacterales bacterium]|nr:DUF2283 domain-containing protein [Solirubrobacterales bacterium]
MKERYAYWERDTDIAWIPTGPEGFVESEKTAWGIVDYDKETGAVTGLEILDASKFLPAELLERLPEPGRPGSAAAA